MSKRVVWVVEYYDNVEKKDRFWCSCESRKLGRQVAKSLCLMDIKNIRVVKYVPADTSKKAGVK